MLKDFIKKANSIHNNFYDYSLVEYKNNKTKLKMQCSKGHIFYMIFNSFQQGRRCPFCAGNQKLTYKQVKNFIEEFKGYILLSTTYINIKTKLKIQCSEGHVFYMSFNSFQQNHRCSICAYNKQKYTYKQVKNHVEFIRKEKLLSTEYINSNTSIRRHRHTGR